MRLALPPPPIVHVGHPALRQRAAPVLDLRGRETRRVIGQLVRALDAHDGSGLAAPQIGEPVRILAVRDLFNRLPSADALAPHLGDVQRARLLRISPVVAINPTITAASDDHDEDWEACLSLPGLWGLVRRPRAVSVRFTAPDGAETAHECVGWAARVFQHELDHLDGVLFIDRLVHGVAGLVHESELHHQLPSEEDGGAVARPAAGPASATRMDGAR
ncbi:hypothetical protein KFE25_008041 [Diacronema lutheri]|uniref:Peptide deformylase n=2 Tax=Diacronema lutheri TaxID=2081491 RepID=A0A8J5XMM7_DIALT|nr:hypothetical protein KFE25_008041 [Diacronema lutheri]